MKKQAKKVSGRKKAETAAPALESAPAPAAPPERSVLDTIRRIKEGEINPVDLSDEDRRLCVQHLGAEGFGVAEIAQVLGRSERTIARDRRRIQEDHALDDDPALAGRVAGTLIAEAELCIGRIRRVTRAGQTTVARNVSCCDLMS